MKVTTDGEQHQDKGECGYRTQKMVEISVRMLLNMEVTTDGD